MRQGKQAVETEACWSSLWIVSSVTCKVKCMIFVVNFQAIRNILNYLMSSIVMGKSSFLIY